MKVLVKVIAISLIASVTEICFNNISPIAGIMVLIVLTFLYVAVEVLFENHQNRKDHDTNQKNGTRWREGKD